MNVALLKAVPAAIPDFVFDITVTYSPVRHKLFFNFGPNQSIGYPAPPPFTATLTGPDFVPYSDELQSVFYDEAFFGLHVAPVYTSYTAELLNEDRTLLQSYPDVYPFSSSGCFVQLVSPPSPDVPGAARYLKVTAHAFDGAGRAATASHTAQLNKAFDCEIIDNPAAITESGTWPLTAVVTGDYTPPAQESWSLLVYDGSGTLLPAAGFSIAPTNEPVAVLQGQLQLVVGANSGQVKVLLSVTSAAGLQASTSVVVPWSRVPFSAELTAPAEPVAVSGAYPLLGSIAGDYNAPVTTSWSLVVQGPQGEPLPETGFTIAPGSGLSAALEVDLAAIPAPSLHPSGSVTITMQSVDSSSALATAKATVLWDRSLPFRVIASCESGRIVQEGGTRFGVAPRGTFTGKVSYSYLYWCFLDASGAEIDYRPPAAGVTPLDAGFYIYVAKVSLWPATAVSIAIYATATDSGEPEATFAGHIGVTPLGPAAAAEDPASTIWAVRLAFLPQGVPYTGPGARPDTTTLNAGMFIEPGFRRDVASYMQLGNQSLAPITAAVDVDGRWTDFTSEPPQLLDAPLPGMRGQRQRRRWCFGRVGRAGCAGCTGDTGACRPDGVPAFTGASHPARHVCCTRVSKRQHAWIRHELQSIVRAIIRPVLHSDTNSSKCLRGKRHVVGP